MTAPPLPQAPEAPVLDVPPERDVRRAADAVRLIVSGAVLVATVLLAVATRSFARQVQHGLITAVAALPVGVRDVLVAVVQIAAVLGPVAAVVVVVRRRRGDALLRVLPAAALGALLAGALVHTVLTHSRPAEWPAVLTDHRALLPVGWPSAVYLAACASAAVTAGPWLSRRWRRAVWQSVAGSVVLSAAAAAVLPMDGVAALAIGGVAASIVLLFGGAPPDRPGPRAVANALVACGLPITVLHEVPASDQRDSEGIRYLAETTEGRNSVRVLGREDHNRDLFHRLWRRLLLTEPGDLAIEPLAAAEHELVMLVAAGHTGARVVEPVTAFPVAGGGAMLVTDDDSRERLLFRNETAGSDDSDHSDDSADSADSADSDDAALTDAWRSVAHLQQHRIAHRALTPDHILVAPDGTTRLEAFARARLDASPTQLGTDLAVLLATSGARIGPERAVACALASLGPDRLATVLPYLQTLALIGSPARHAVAEHDRAAAQAARAAAKHRTLRAGGGPSLLRDLSGAVREACHVEEPKKAHLARLTWKKALALVGALLVIHLILPQLANAGTATAALKTADWWWVLAAVPIVLLSQVFSAFLQAGTIPERLPFPPNVLVQFASSFLNRITPNNVGGMALNLRFLQKAGVETGSATAAVGLQSVAGALASGIVSVTFFAWTGQRHSGVHLGMPSGHWLLPAVCAVLVAAGLLALTGPGRRFVHDKVWHFLKAAGQTVAAVATSPTRLTEIAGGALGLPLIQISALAICLHAFGVHLPLGQVGAVYMASRIVASATPTPGGLGALEAALITGMTALGAAAGPVTSAVLVYRLISFWLNIPVGAVALQIVQRRGYV
ncbi:uncharacterized membrane protein YbhN (UPF0104 family) [Catenulispora sp. GAS73]|uniref:flippase-like domain-containing protein n=1 Tax=Catenulispora sp. GAS73 TaxID=3156269 RepID=UPI00351255C6